MIIGQQTYTNSLHRLPFEKSFRPVLHSTSMVELSASATKVCRSDIISKLAYKVSLRLRVLQNVLRRVLRNDGFGISDCDVPTV